MGRWLNDTDLTPFVTIEPAKAAKLIAGAEADAILAAPALEGITLTDWQLDALKAILLDTVLRSNATGPFNTSPADGSGAAIRRPYLSRRERTKVRRLAGLSGAFAIETGITVTPEWARPGYTDVPYYPL